MLYAEDVGGSGQAPTRQKKLAKKLKKLHIDVNSESGINRSSFEVHRYQYFSVILFVIS
jgi:hypothetical protein